jgi:hypothetical protein
MKLLFVSNVAGDRQRTYTMKWRPAMKLLFATEPARYARSTYTLTKYVEVGRALGHEVAVFGEKNADVPALPYSLEVEKFDFAIFVIHVPSDFPDLPYLAQLLDRMPKDRRVIIDCLGRFNETVRVEHDFNHLEKLDGHQGWEWVEGFQAVASRILQTTRKPLRSDVQPFLFLGFDPAAVARPYASAAEAAGAWAGNGAGKPYGLVYVGNNWQRWTQVRKLLEDLEGLNGSLGRIALVGWDWARRPDWAVQLGLESVNVDPELFGRLGVETREAIPFNEVNQLLGQARFSPVFHRPLFQKLGFVTNRTFETFCADTVPILMLPDDTVREIYGEGALPLAPGKQLRERVEEMIRRPEPYWDAVLKTRAHLAEHHSYQRRFEELINILKA